MFHGPKTTTVLPSSRPYSKPDNPAKGAAMSNGERILMSFLVGTPAKGNNAHSKIKATTAETGSSDNSSTTPRMAAAHSLAIGLIEDMLTTYSHNPIGKSRNKSLIMSDGNDGMALKNSYKCMSLAIHAIA